MEIFLCNDKKSRFPIFVRKFVFWENRMSFNALKWLILSKIACFMAKKYFFHQIAVLVR